MSTQRFHVGDTVANTHRVGGAERRRVGTVTEVTGTSVQVAFPGMQGPVWLPLGRSVELVSSRRAADARPARAPTETGAEASAADAPSDAAAALNLSALEAQGIDPLALFLALGRDLVARASEGVEAARVAVARAETDVRDAEALLTEARTGAEKARGALAEAEQKRAAPAAKVAG